MNTAFLFTEEVVITRTLLDSNSQIILKKYSKCFPHDFLLTDVD